MMILCMIDIYYDTYNLFMLSLFMDLFLFTDKKVGTVLLTTIKRAE